MKNVSFSLSRWRIQCSCPNLTLAIHLRKQNRSLESDFFEPEYADSLMNPGRRGGEAEVRVMHRPAGLATFGWLSQWNCDVGNGNVGNGWQVDFVSIPHFFFYDRQIFDLTIWRPDSDTHRLLFLFSFNSQNWLLWCCIYFFIIKPHDHLFLFRVSRTVPIKLIVISSTS